jgi:hypothetical protein
MRHGPVRRGGVRSSYASMPRYEVPGRFWTIELDGASFITLSSSAFARSADDERIADQTANGYALAKPSGGGAPALAHLDARCREPARVT